MIQTPAVQEETRRNGKCPCGSGLKFKKCHGSSVIQQAAKRVAVLMTLKLITEARGRAGLIEREECDQLVSRINTAMIEMIVGPEAGAAEPEAPLTVRDVAELQKDLDRCPTCGQVTFGKECIKCKEKTVDKTVA